MRVEKNLVIEVNRIKDQRSKSIKVEKVLFGKSGASYLIGTPYIDEAYVECDILCDKRGKKVIAFKYRDRKSSQSKKGHRQELTQLKVKDVHLPGTAKTADKEEAPKAKKTGTKKTEK